MKFRTEYTPTKSELRLTPQIPVLTVGSCFAENIAVKMRESLWDACNPAGTLFNPISIAKVVNLALKDKEYDETERMTFKSDGVWHSWLFGTKFSALTKENLIQEIDKSLQSFRNSLGNAQALIVTFGTANCYFFAERGGEGGSQLP